MNLPDSSRKSALSSGQIKETLFRTRIHKSRIMACTYPLGAFRLYIKAIDDRGGLRGVLEKVSFRMILLTYLLLFKYLVDTFL